MKPIQLSRRNASTRQRQYNLARAGTHLNPLCNRDVGHALTQADKRAFYSSETSRFINIFSVLVDRSAKGLDSSIGFDAG